jgi:anti-anti-sigma factor
MPTTVTIAERAGRVVLTITGPADLGTLPTWHRAVTGLVADHPGRDLVVDLDPVTVLDDTVLGVLLGAAADARESGGSLTVVCSRTALLDRLRATGVDLVLAIQPGSRP